MEPLRYRLVVEGDLGSRYSAAFEGMSIRCADGTTVIAGPVRDQAELQRHIARAAALGLTLVSVMRDNGPSEPHDSPG